MILVRKNSSLLLGFLAGTSKISILLPPTNLLTPPRLFTTKANDPSPKTPFIVKYLIDSLGLSSSEADKCSKFLTHVKSPSKPDSVIEFFRKNGFTDADIKRIICCNSKVVCAKIDSTLKPKFEVMGDLGFSDTQITKLITANPLTLNYLSYCNVAPRIEFYNTIIDSKDDIIKAIARDICLLTCSLEKTIKPNIAFLRECQFSNERISSLLIHSRRVISRPLNTLKSIAKRVDELGVPRESGMFYYGFLSLCRLNSDLFDAKIKLLISLGFSESEVLSLFLKHPLILCLSGKNLRYKVDFFVKEVGCKLSYVSCHPFLLSLSLTKRLIPRNYVMELIMKKGFLKKKIDIVNFASMPERKFLEKYIVSFQKRMPELPDVYLSASAGIFLY
ncbi:hypothetical protein KSP40_PGU005391 [Platanthera guangdongensis]|uniref:Uncharacterized protein n=1 Tax=Platanthera guangdongensis TaxID=2320717 RepID=A0ABR2N3K8_9ASPA